ncbi:MAG: zinc ribbon domain-containing protein [Desulfobacterales bacterium]|jgi:hypothetical protein
MFFFIGGITPKTKRLDAQPVRCPNCGLVRAFRTRVDHWLHLFFIPVFPVKRGQEVLFCERCNGPVDGRASGWAPFRAEGRNPCPFCGKDLERDFRFCPHCGQRLRT